MENISKKIASVATCVVVLLPFIVLEVDSQQYAQPAAALPQSSGISGLSSHLLLSLLHGLPRDPPMCNFGCPIYGQSPTEREGHVPRYNGCGSYGFERLLVPEMDLFVDCCNAHDICYDTCGASKFECDQTFNTCLLQRCSRIVQNLALTPNLAGNCMSTIQLLGTGPIVAGCNAFTIAQSNACECTY